MPLNGGGHRVAAAAAILLLSLALLTGDCAAHHGLFFANIEPSVVPSAGVVQQLRLRISDGADLGVPRSDLRLVHERLLHVMVLSGDWATFAHIHPEDFPELESEHEYGRGVYSTELAFPAPGNYTFMIEFAVPGRGASQELQIIDLTASVMVEGGQGGVMLTQGTLQEQLEGTGSEISSSQPKSSMSPLSDTSRQYHADLQVNGGKPVFAGSCVSLEFSYATSAGGELTDLVPYLGAAAHVAVAHQSMEPDLMTHTHAMAMSAGTQHSHAMPPDDSLAPPPQPASDTKDLCAIEVENMPRPPDRFGSTVTAYARFPRAGHYAVVAGVQRGAETVFTRFVVHVLDIPVMVYTNPDILEAGEPAEVDVRLAAEGIWGANPSARLFATIASADLQTVQHLGLHPSSDGLKAGLLASASFPDAGLYHVHIHGVLITDAQAITISYNHTLQVVGESTMGQPRRLFASPMAKFGGVNVAMARIAAGGAHSEMQAAEIAGFAFASDGSSMLTMEVNGGGVVLAEHCTSLKFRVYTSKSNFHQLQVADGVAGKVAWGRQGEGLQLDGVQYTAAMPQNSREELQAEGFDKNSQQDLIRHLCTPLSTPLRAAASTSPAAVAFVTFRQPGVHFVDVTLATAAGEMHAQFALQVCPDTNAPIMWSSSCAWPVQPAKGDRVLIPGGRHIVLDVSTPALAEVMVQGRLEVAAAEQELTLRAGRVAVDFGGTFQAGSPAAPLPGRFNLVLDRGGLVYLGGSGLLAGSALLAVGAGSVSLVGERDEVQQSNMLAISAPVNSGAKQLIVPGATWRPGQQLLISDALNSTDYHAEVATVAVAKKAAAGRVALAVGLKHAYNAGASVLLLSRSISVTSEQYADGGASIKIAPPAPWAVQSAAGRSARRLLMHIDAAEQALQMPGGEAASGGARHLLHSDPTASLAKAADFMVAGGGDGNAYYVLNATTEAVFDGVEFVGLGRFGDGYPALSLLMPDGTCPFRGPTPLSQPPRLTVRSSSFHSLHAGCLHLGGLPSDAQLHGTVCLGALGDGIALEGGSAEAPCEDAPPSVTAIEECSVIASRQADGARAVLLGVGERSGGITVRGWAPAGESQLRINSNVVAGSEGDGFSLRGSRVTEFRHNIVHHAARTGLLHSPDLAGGCPLRSEASRDSSASSPVDLPAVNLTVAANREQQVCAAMQELGVLLTEAATQMALPTSLPSLPPTRFLDIDTWTEPITISQRPVDALTYFHVEIPEDAAGVKLMVDQLAGNVDILINPYGGAPCHEKFDGCQLSGKMNPQLDRSRMHGIGIGFSAQPGQDPLLNLPLPAYSTGTWIMAIGCKDCTFRLGVNVTRCGGGWMGFPSEETVLSPALAARMAVSAAVELAGQNFTCVPVIAASVNEPQRNITLKGPSSSVFLRVEVPDFTSQLWTRVRRVRHHGPPSSLHFRTLQGRLPTFSPGRATSARTLSAKYDVITPAPDVREDQEKEDSAVPVDHYSQMMMFLKPGPYFTVVTQAVSNTSLPAEVDVEVEVGTVACATGRHVAAEPYFFPPHHVEDMVEAARDGPIKRVCSMVIQPITGGVYDGGQGPAERYERVAGETRGGRTSVFLIDVPPYSTRLKIDFHTRQGDQQMAARAELYLRYGVPPVILDQEDYVQWDYDRFTRLQGRDQIAQFDLPWYEVYERWGHWYVVVDWLTFNADGALRISVDTGPMPACPGDPACSGNGVCWSVDGQGVCHCQAGWHGDDCGHTHQALEPTTTTASPTEGAEPGNKVLAPEEPQGAGEDELLAARVAAEAAEAKLNSRILELEGNLATSEAAVAELQARLGASERDAREAHQAPIEPRVPTEAECAQLYNSCGETRDAAPVREVPAVPDFSQELAECRADGEALRSQLGRFQQFGGLRGVKEAAAELSTTAATVANLTAEVDTLRARHCDVSAEVTALREGVDREGVAPYRGPLFALAVVLAGAGALWMLAAARRRMSGGPAAFHRLAQDDGSDGMELTGGGLPLGAAAVRYTSPGMRPRGERSPPGTV